MRRIVFLSAIAVASLLSFWGCDKENPENENVNNETKGPKVETLSAEKGPLYVVSLTGRVCGLEGVALDFKCGIEYSIDASFPEDKTIQLNANKKYSEDPFTINITHVSPDVQYYYRAYYISQSTINYGEVRNFAFTWDSPQVTTGGASLSIINGSEFFICRGIVNGLSDIFKNYPSSEFNFGIQYSTSESFDVSSTNMVYAKDYNSSFGDTISCNIYNFDYNKKYYYRTFFDENLMHDGNNRVYGEIKEFICSWDVPQVTTLTAECSEINGVACLKCKGLISGLGDIVKKNISSTIRYGIQYSTSESDVITIYANNYSSQMGDTIMCVIPNFECNVDYEYRAFFELSDRGIYEEGEIKDFIYSWDVQVTTLTAENSEIDGVACLICKGLINGLGDVVKNYLSQTIRYGIQYSTSESDVITIYANNYNSQMGDTIMCVIPNVIFNVEYEYQAFLEFTSRSIIEVGETKSIIVTPKQNGSENGYEYIELGLSVKWATCNVGATKPEEHGNHYAWGETEIKSDFGWSAYKWCKGSNDTMTKYCYDSDYGYNGYTDTKTTLDPEDDVAHVKWGGSWRIPTVAEQDELRNNCTWRWFDNGNSNFNGVAGWKITSNIEGYTDRFIFLPCAGYCGPGIHYANDGYYWSSSISNSNGAYCIYFSGSLNRSSIVRWRGCTVRPVCP